MNRAGNLAHWLSTSRAWGITRPDGAGCGQGAKRRMRAAHGTYSSMPLSRIFESAISTANEAKQNALQAKRSESPPVLRVAQTTPKGKARCSDQASCRSLLLPPPGRRSECIGPLEHSSSSSSRAWPVRRSIGGASGTAFIFSPLSAGRDGSSPSPRARWCGHGAGPRRCRQPAPSSAATPECRTG